MKEEGILFTGSKGKGISWKKETQLGVQRTIWMMDQLQSLLEDVTNRYSVP